MAAGQNQKQKLLILAEIFSRETDERHALTLTEIIERLERAGVNAERKTLYRDFEELQSFGYDIISTADSAGVMLSFKSHSRVVPTEP